MEKLKTFSIRASEQLIQSIKGLSEKRNQSASGLMRSLIEKEDDLERMEQSYFRNPVHAMARFKEGFGRSLTGQEIAVFLDFCVSAYRLYPESSSIEPIYVNALLDIAHNIIQSCLLNDIDFDEYYIKNTLRIKDAPKNANDQWSDVTLEDIMMAYRLYHRDTRQSESQWRTSVMALESIMTPLIYLRDTQGQKITLNKLQKIKDINWLVSLVSHGEPDTAIMPDQYTSGLNDYLKLIGFNHHEKHIYVRWAHESHIKPVLSFLNALDSHLGMLMSTKNQIQFIKESISHPEGRHQSHAEMYIRVIDVLTRHVHRVKGIEDIVTSDLIKTLYPVAMLSARRMAEKQDITFEPHNDIHESLNQSAEFYLKEGGKLSIQYSPYSQFVFIFEDGRHVMGSSSNVYELIKLMINLDFNYNFMLSHHHCSNVFCIYYRDNEFVINLMQCGYFLHIKTNEFMDLVERFKDEFSKDHWSKIFDDYKNRFGDI